MEPLYDDDLKGLHALVARQAAVQVLNAARLQFVALPGSGLHSKVYCKLTMQSLSCVAIIT